MAKRTWARAGLLLLALTSWTAAIYVGCAAGSNPLPSDGDGGEHSGGAASTSSVTGTTSPNNTAGSGGAGGDLFTGTGGVIEDAGLDPDSACGKFTAEAEQAPAAMLIVLDKTASMTGGKWSAAQLAVVSAIDKDVFDSMSLGLVTFPEGWTNPPPQCLCDAIIAQNEAALPGICGLIDCCGTALPNGVSCGISGLPQVAMAPAGKDKSNGPMGPRKQIYQYLVNQMPLSNGDDGSPIYEAMLAGYNALKAYPNVDERMLVLVTDGGFSCASTSNRGGYLDDANCQDWEYPDTVNKLISDHRTDANTPVNTFVVGVPGSNSTGQKMGMFATPPYNMLLALSTYAVSGSPDTVDPACDKNAVFTQNGAAPALPCHIDLSNGQMFNANALADAISKIRGDALGCVYPLPEPPPNEMILLDKVNVEATLDGNVFPIPKRSNPNDDCKMVGCWDYKGPNNDIEVLGKSCDDIGAAAAAKVEVLVGCETILK